MHKIKQIFKEKQCLEVAEKHETSWKWSVSTSHSVGLQLNMVTSSEQGPGKAAVIYAVKEKTALEPVQPEPSHH